MKIRTMFNEQQVNIKLSKLNIFYGANKSGKTSFLNHLVNGIEGKNTKNFLLNNSMVNKNDFSVFHITTKSDLSDQLKLGNKSFLKEKIFDILNQDLTENEHIKNLFTVLNHKISDFFKLSINTSLDSINADINDDKIDETFITLLTFLVNNNELIPSSSNKELLYSSVLNSAKNNQKSIVIIDNFDHDFDELYLINFINKIINLSKEYEITFILSTAKPSSMPYIINDFSIFSLKNDTVLPLTNFDFFLKKYFINTNTEETISFEDFLINSSHFILDSDIQFLKNKIKTSIQYNIARMLVNENYVISEDYIEDKININYSNNFEKSVIHSIHHYLTKQKL